MKEGSGGRKVLTAHCIHLRQQVSLALKVRGGTASAEAKSNIPVQETASEYKGTVCKHRVFRNYKWVPDS